MGTRHLALLRSRRWELEPRLAPAVTSNVVAGVLTITGDVDNDTIAVTVSGNNVLVNGANPGGSAVAATTIESILINAGAGSDTIDLTTIAKTDFTALTQVVARGEDDADTIRYANTLSGAVGITFEGGNDIDTFELSGSGDSVTHDRPAGTTTIDTQTITQDCERVSDSIQAKNRTFVASGLFTLSRGDTADDGNSRFVNSTNPAIVTEYPTPTTKLRIEFGAGEDSLTLDGLDTKNATPTSIQFDGGEGNDSLRINAGFSGATTANAVSYDYLAGTIRIDTNSFQQSGFEGIFDALDAAERSFLSQGSDTIDAGTTNGDGLSRAFVTDSPNLFTEFRNPTKALTYGFGTGNDVLNYRGLDASGAMPTTLQFDGGDGVDQFFLSGSTKAIPTSLVYDITSVTGGTSLSIGLTDEPLNVSRFEQGIDQLIVADRTFLLLDVATVANGGALLADGPTRNDGISRLISVLNGKAVDNSFIDFANPTASLTIDGRAGDDLLNFLGIDAKGTPASILFRGGEGKDTFRLTSVATDVIHDFTASPTKVSIDALNVNYDTEVVVDLSIAQNRTFFIRPGTAEVISDNDVANDGISRISNLALGISTDFLNPTKLLTVNGTSQAESIGFKSLDIRNPPPIVSFNGGDQNDAFVIVPNLSSQVIIDGGAGEDTLTVTPDGATLAGATANQFTFTDRQSVTYQNIEIVTPFDGTSPPPPPTSGGLTPPAFRPRVGQNDTSYFAAVTGFGTVVYNGPTRITAVGAFFARETPNGVYTILADVTGDTIPEIISGTGPGVIAEVRVIDAFVGTRLLTLRPFEGLFAGGLFLAAGDLNADGVSDIVVTPDDGGGGRVTVFDGRSGNVIADFFGIEDLNFRGGARAAVGDINGDNLPDLIVAAGRSGGPRVAIFDGRFVVTTPAGQTPPKIIPDFFVFEPTQRDGVFLTAGDLDGDGAADLIASGGPGGGPRVLALNGRFLSANQIVPQLNFFAYDPAGRNGVRVAAKDFNLDGRADLAVGGQTSIKVYINAELLQNPSGPREQVEDTPFPLTYPNGIFVG